MDTQKTCGYIWKKNMTHTGIQDTDLIIATAFSRLTTFPDLPLLMYAVQTTYIKNHSLGFI